MIEIKLYKFLKQCECHWVDDQHDDVYVNLGIQDVGDLWRLLLNHKSIYDDGGFDSEIKDGYIILNSFNQILDHFAIEPKAFYEELKIED